MKIEDIDYTKKEYSKELYDSVKRIGLSFPIKLRLLSDNHYECTDGHKRLTILEELGIADVNAIVINNGNNRSNDCWRNRNYH